MITIIRMGRLQGIFICFLLLKFKTVEGNCRNTTLKMFDDQIQAIQRSVRTMVLDGPCGNNEVGVGFQVYMGSHKTFAKGVPWVYDRVVTNTHNAYSATTGKFIAPERGLYIFSYDTLSDHASGKLALGALYVNGNIKSYQACDNGGSRTWISCSTSAVVVLKKGDVVYVADYYATATIRAFHTAFSGAKLN